MRKFVTFLLAVAVLAAAGCVGSSRPEDGVTRIVCIVRAMTNEFWIDMRKGAEEYAAANGIELSFQSPEKEIDVERQIQMMENTFVPKADVIIPSAAGSQTLIPAIVRANETGVPVTLVNDTIEPEVLEAYDGHVTTYVGINQYAAAKPAGEDVVARHPEGGNVVLLEGIAGISVLQQRFNGFKDQVAANPRFRIVASQTVNDDHHQASNVMQSTLQSNPDVDAVWAINAEMKQRTVQAIQQSGATCKIAVYGFDVSSDGIVAIRARTLVGSVTRYPKLQAEGAINATLDAMTGRNLPAHTMTKAELITATNVNTLEQ